MAKTRLFLFDKFPTPEEFEKLGNVQKAFWYAAIYVLDWYVCLHIWILKKRINFRRWFYGLPPR